jgi:hypothetical protein
MDSRARVRSAAPTFSASDSAVFTFDDPVPSDTALFCDTAVMPTVKPHSIERQVQKTLLAQPNLKFTSLVVRRLRDGVCIEGIVEDSEDSDVCSLARQVAGVNRVVNHLLVHRPEPATRPNKPH